MRDDERSLPTAQAASKLLSYYRRFERTRSAAAIGLLESDYALALEMLADLRQELELLCQDGKNRPRELAGFVTAVAESAAQLACLKQELREPFMLFVMGMGKYGKSTLVNVLLGGRYADVDSLPKTWKIDVFTAHGLNGSATLRFRNGQIETHPTEKVRKILAEEESRREESEKQIEAVLEAEKPRLRSVEAVEELKRKLEREMLYRSPIIEVRWGVPAARWARHFNIVDTPGLFQKVWGEVRATIKDYYHRADGVIWLIDATKVSARKARELLEEITRAGVHEDGAPDDILAVLNGVDKVRRLGGPQAVARVLEEALRIFKGHFEVILPLSAKEALEAVEKGDSSLMESSGLRVLEETIEDRFLRKAEVRRVASKSRALQEVLLGLVTRAEHYRDRVLADYQHCFGAVQEFEERVSGLRATALAQLENLFTRHEAAVRQNFERHRRQLEQRPPGARELIYREVLEVPRLCREAELLLKSSVATLGRWIALYSDRVVLSDYPHLDRELGRTPSAGLELDETTLKATCPDLDIEGPAFLLSGVASFLATALFGPVGLLAGLLLHGSGISHQVVETLAGGSIWNRIYQTCTEVRNRIRSSFEEALDRALNAARERIKALAAESFGSRHVAPENLNRLLAVLHRFPALQVYADGSRLTAARIIREGRLSRDGD